MAIFSNPLFATYSAMLPQFFFTFILVCIHIQDESNICGRIWMNVYESCLYTLAGWQEGGSGL